MIDDPKANSTPADADDLPEGDATEADARPSLFGADDDPCYPTLGEDEAEALAELLLGAWPAQAAADREKSAKSTAPAESDHLFPDREPAAAVPVPVDGPRIFGPVVDVRDERVELGPSKSLFPARPVPTVTPAPPTSKLFIARSGGQEPAADGDDLRSVGFIPADPLDEEPHRRIFLAAALLAVVAVLGAGVLYFAGGDASDDVATDAVSSSTTTPTTSEAPTTAVTSTDAPVTLRRTTSTLPSSTTTTTTTTAPVASPTRRPNTTRSPATTRRPGTSDAPSTAAPAPTSTSVATTVAPSVTFNPPTWTATTAAPTTAAPATTAPVTAAPTTNAAAASEE